MIWRKIVESALVSIGGQGSLGEIYKAVEAIQTGRSSALPRSWQAIVRRELEHNSSDSQSYQGRFDLFYSVEGIGSGVWGLRSAETGTPVALDIGEPEPQFARIETYRILRDTEMARRVKKLHNNTCQICGNSLKLQGSKTYAEAHHVKPLGSPHYGPDVASNIITLCPTHHVLCDYGAIALDSAALRSVNGHAVSQHYIDYHNTVIVNSCR